MLAATLVLTACTSSSPGRADRRGADLDALVSAVETIHPEPFGAIDEAGWRRDVADVRARAASMSEDEFLVAVAQLANLGDRSGHGGLFPTDQPGLTLWPVRLYEFADGWYVVTGDPGMAGSRVEAIGGRPIADVAAAVAPIVPRDNAQSLRARLATYLVVPRFLRGLGLYGPLTLVRPDGTREDVTPREVPAREYATLAGLDVPQIPPALPRPSFAPREPWFWVTRRGTAVVVGYERVAEEMQDGTRVQWLVSAIEEALARRTSALVIDVRRNPGGDTGAGDRVMTVLRHTARQGRVPVRVLIGRGTYSAAAILFAQLRADAPGVRFYGEASGGGARTFGGPQARTLPHSGIVVQVAGDAASAPTADVAAIEPDVRVDVTWAAYAAGRDPVLDAALAPAGARSEA